MRAVTREEGSMPWMTNALQSFPALLQFRAVPPAVGSSVVREGDTTPPVPLPTALHTYLSPEQPDADPLFDRLIALNQAAFADWCFPTAYYALVAARLEADAAQDVDGLWLVHTLAEEQAAALADTERALSPPPASGYGSLLTMLAHQIQSTVSPDKACVAGKPDPW
jgi:hypothetical protein